MAMKTDIVTGKKLKFKGSFSMNGSESATTQYSYGFT